MFLLDVYKNKAHIITRANIAYGFEKQMNLTHPSTCKKNAVLFMVIKCF